MQKCAYLKMQEFPKGAMMYTLANRSGLEVDILNYGAIIRAIRVPDKTGKLTDVTLGFSSVEDYSKCTSYIGATVGRTAGRIRGGKFALDGKDYQLSKNENGKTTLHGGFEGFNRKMWKVTVWPENPLKIDMEYHSVDGEEGYPGNVLSRVSFELASDKNVLTIRYHADVDKPCPISLTNHTYFNLNGEQSGKDVLNNEIMIAADKYLPVDPDCLPTGEQKDVTKTPMDFRTPTAIGKRIHDKYEEFKITRGYDNPWMLHKSSDVLCHAHSPATGIDMAIRTTEPCVVMYTGNYLDGGMKGKSGVPYGQHYGFCLETSRVENSMNEPSFPSCIVRPGEIYEQVTSFEFSVKS